jgi:hypothetical protein
MAEAPQWLSYHEGVPTEWTPTSHYEQWGTYGEATAAFARYSIQQGWHLLEGPSGRAGHAWNAPGPDIIAYRATGPFALEITDNKALESGKNVSDASALRQNLLDGVRQRVAHYGGRQFDTVPRIDEIRSALRGTQRALETDTQTPSSVRLVVTNAAGAPENVLSSMRRAGIEFEDVMTVRGPGTPRLTSAVRNRIPPELYEGRGETAAARSGGTRSSPAMRAGAVATLLLMAAGPVLGWLHDYAERGRAEEKVKALGPRIREHLEASPDDGVLLVFVYRQNAIGHPVPVFHNVRVYFGRTYPEAVADSSNALVEGPPSGMEFVYQEKWIPPPLPGPNVDGFSNTERGLRPEERGTLPSERGLCDAPSK